MSITLTVIIIIFVGATFFFLSKVPSAGTSSDKKTGLSGGMPSGPPGKSEKTNKVKKQLEQARDKKSLDRLHARSLHQVGVAPEKFAGRRKQILKLYTENREGLSIMGFFGEAGHGKTCTARKLIDHLNPYYPNAQIYFDFETCDDPAGVVKEAMTHVVQSFTPEVNSMIPQSALLTQYRSVLKEKKAVLFFDNLVSLDQLQVLIPPETCALVVTSRKKLDHPQALWEEMAAMSLEDTRDLLLSICNRIGFWTTEIGKICSNNPIAISMCARVLLTFNNIDPEAFSTKLREQAKQLEQQDSLPPSRIGIESTLAVSYSILSDEFKVFLRKLTLFPQSFDDDMVQFICEDKGSEFLDIICKLGFVDFNQDLGRYTFHPLVREFLKRKGNKSSLALVQARHATYFMTALSKMHDHFSSGEASKIRHAMNLFDREWLNLKMGQDWAYTNSLKDTEAAKLCEGYAEMAFDLLKLRQPPEVRIAWMEAGLQAAQTLQQEDAELIHTLNLGREYLSTQNYKKAMTYMEKVLSVSEKKGDISTQLEALHQLCVAYLSDRQTGQARKYIDQQLEIAEANNLDAVKLRALESLANLNLQSNDAEGAIKHFESALELARQLKLPSDESRVLMGLGELYVQTGKTDEAVELFNQGLKLARESKEKKTEAALQKSLGDAFTLKKEPAKAVPYYEKALQLFREFQDIVNEAEVLGSQGLCRAKAGDPESGFKLVEKADRLFKKLKQFEKEVRLLEHLGNTQLEIGKLEDALKTFRKQLARARKYNLKEPEGQANVNLGTLLEKKGSIPEAISHLKSACEVFKKTKPIEEKKIRKRVEQLELKTAGSESS